MNYLNIMVVQSNGIFINVAFGAFFALITVYNIGINHGIFVYSLSVLPLLPKLTYQYNMVTYCVLLCVLFWLLWHGFFLIQKKKTTKPRRNFSPLAIELVYRFISIVVFLIVFPFIMSSEPVYWQDKFLIDPNWVGITLTKMFLSSFILLLYTILFSESSIAKKFFRRQVDNILPDKFFLLALSSGMIIWLLNTFIDLMLFNKFNHSFMELFALSLNNHEIIMRNSLVLMVLLIYYAILHYSKKQFNMKRSLENKNRTLLALREINSLIIREKNPQHLIRETVKTLTKVGIYDKCWILIQNNENGESYIEYSGYDTDEFDNFRDKILNHDFHNNCVSNNDLEFIISKDPARDCQSCVLSKMYKKQTAIVSKLVFQNHYFGIFSATIPDNITDYDKEHSLFCELSMDLSFALFSKTQSTLLSESELLFENVFNQASVGISIFNNDLSLLRVNQKLCDLLDYPMDVVLDKSFYGFTHPDDISFDEELLDSIYEKHQNQFSYEKRFITRNGDVIWTQIFLNVVRNLDNSIKYIVSVVNDITEYKNTLNELKKSNQRLGIATKSANLGIWQFDIGTNKLIWDDIMYKMYDVEKNNFNVSYETWSSILHSEDIEKAEQAVRNALDGLYDLNTVFRIKTKNNEIRHIKANGIVLRNTSNEPCEMIGINQDITAQIELEQNKISYLHELEFLSNAAIYMLQHSTDDTLFTFATRMIARLVPQSIVLTLNYHDEKDVMELKAYSKLSSIVDKAISALGKNPIGMFFPISDSGKDMLLEGRLVEGPADLSEITKHKLPKALADTIQKIIGLKKVYLMGLLIEKKFIGEVMIFSLNETPPLNLELVETFINQFSIALQSYRIRKNLEKSEEKYRLTIESTSDGLWDWNIENGSIDVSKSYLDIIEDTDILSFKEMWLERIHPDDKTEIVKSLQNHLEGYTSFWQVEYRALTGSGKYKWILIKGKIVEYTSENIPLRMVGTISDISERKQSEKALRKSEERLNEAQRVTHLGSWELKIPENTFIWSDEMYNIYELDPSTEPISMDLVDSLFHPDDIEKVTQIYKEALITFESFNFKARIITPGGKQKTIDIHGSITEFKNGKPLTMIGTFRDITTETRNEEEKKQLEMQIRQAQKLETIGTLAGGIAHDFNNLLTPILGYSEIALMKKPDNPKLVKQLEGIRKSANRAKDLVKQILTFSRQMEQDKKPLNIADIINDSISLMRATIPSSIKITKEIEKNIGNVIGDITQINQIIMNLCTNSYHSMIETGGTLSIRLEKAVLNEQYRKLEPGDYAKLIISDTGSGIPDEIIDRIFEPFFTTKEIGKGTGLGLSVVHGIVENHNGLIDIDSEMEKGTTFSIYFPIVNIQLEEDNTIIEDYEMGTEKVLIVDDFEANTKMYKLMLESLGYDMTAFYSSLEALVEIKENPSTYDVIITDLSMPELNGIDLAKAIRTFNKEIPIIVITGNPESISEDLLLDSVINRFILKPIRMKKIARILREILDKTPST